MCRYNDCENKGLIQSLIAFKNNELPIDEAGYCLFHSKNEKWQVENNFTDYFLALIQGITERYKDINIIKWNYSFAGFNFPNNLNLEIASFEFKADIKLTNCTVRSGIRFTNCKIRSVTIIDSTFHENLIFDQTNIEYGIYSKSVLYNGSFKLLNSELKGSSFFIDNKFSGNSAGNEFLIKMCEDIEYISFENSSFNLSTAIVKSTLNKEVKFLDCKINEEFIFDDITIKDSLNFYRSNFTITENVNPIYSSTHFENITLERTGKIKFAGKEERENVVFNELSISFKTPPLGLIVFENFNLNKIFHKTKERLFTLEKQGIVEIGDGCRKYYCQTQIFTITTNYAAQELILSLTKIFCKYFEFSEHKSLGIEIVERTPDKIKYFYFTDDKISYQEFADRLKANEYDMWHTFSKLTTYNTSKIEDLNIQFLLNDISSFFLKLGTLVNYKSSKESDVLNVLNSISSELESDEKVKCGTSILNIKELISAIKKQSNNFFNNDNKFVLIHSPIDMKITNNFTGPIEKVINTENFFESNDVSEKQRQEITNALEEIKKEDDKQKKENKLKKFIKEWGDTITKVGMTIIKNAFE